MLRILTKNKFKGFTGVNNLQQPWEITDTELQKAENVDIDNAKKLKRRTGFTRILTGTSPHSLWSHGPICLFVEGGHLKRLKDDFTAVILRSDLTPNLVMRYAFVNDLVYYTNNQVIGVVDNFTTYDVPTTTASNKAPIRAGHEITYFMGRLYIARGPVIEYSDVGHINQRDIRYGFLQMNGHVSLMAGVRDGLYIADGTTHFLAGTRPADFVKTEVADYDAIPYTASRVKRQWIGDGVSSTVIMWASKEGICMGEDGGKLTNITYKRYEMPTASRGASLVRATDGMNHLITVLEN